MDRFYIPPYITAESTIAHQTSSYRTMCQDIDKALCNGISKQSGADAAIAPVVNVDMHLKTLDPLMISPLRHSLFEPKVGDALLPVTLKLPSYSASFQKVVSFRK